MKSSAFLLILLIMCGCADQAVREPEIPEIPSQSPPSEPSQSPPSESSQSPPSEPEFTIPLSQEDDKAYKKALQDIELYRKGDIIITIHDKEGIPLPGLTVEYHQVEHSFLFGIFNSYDPTIFSLLQEAGFNYVTFHFNWQATEPQKDLFDFQGLKYTWGIEPLYAQKFTLKAHALTWMCEDVTPEYMRHVSFEQYIEKSYHHLSTIVAHFNPYIHIWNVINEPMAEWANIYDFSQSQVEEAIAAGVQAIREADPEGKIIINNASPAGENYIVAPYDFLKDVTVDYDIIGLQFYYNGYTREFEAPRHSLAYLATLVDHFSALNKEIHITELSVPSHPLNGRKGYWGRQWSEDLQAQYAKVAYTLFFSKKHVKAITWWDASDSTSFIYHGGLLTETNNPKKIYDTLKDMFNSWTTHGSHKTDTTGTIAFRGFGGVYELTITDPETGVILERTVSVKEQHTNTISIIVDHEALQHEQPQKKEEPAEDITSILNDIEWLLNYWETQGKNTTEYRTQFQHIQDTEPDAEKAEALRWQLAITRQSEHSWETFENTNEAIFDLSWADSAALLANGVLHKSIPLKKGKITLKILAKGDKGGGHYPSFFVMAGTAVSDVVTITSSQWQWYEVTLYIEQAEDIAIIFTNDYYDPDKGEDRNLYISQVILIEYFFRI
jgi:GH35 family endo-1,4-beta-xylanase